MWVGWLTVSQELIVDLSSVRLEVIRCMTPALPYVRHVPSFADCLVCSYCLNLLPLLCVTCVGWVLVGVGVGVKLPRNYTNYTQITPN